MTTIDQLTDNLRQTVKTGNLTRQSLPLCPDVSLYLISEDYPKDQLPHKEMLAIMEQPAYWSFCWASGQVLAAYMLSQTELCRGKSVLDLGAGSGVVVIAAAKPAQQTLLPVTLIRLPWMQAVPTRHSMAWPLICSIT